MLHLVFIWFNLRKVKLIARNEEFQNKIYILSNIKLCKKKVFQKEYNMCCPIAVVNIYNCKKARSRTEQQAQ